LFSPQESRSNTHRNAKIPKSDLYARWLVARSLTKAATKDFAALTTTSFMLGLTCQRIKPTHGFASAAKRFLGNKNDVVAAFDGKVECARLIVLRLII
jgi:hypothetical protein